MGNMSTAGAGRIYDNIYYRTISMCPICERLLLGEVDTRKGRVSQGGPPHGRSR